MKKILISHRGNINGVIPELENNPNHIKSVIELGYDVEIDLWFVNNEFYLGHDEPTYQIEPFFLFNQRLWIHCKNLEAMNQILPYKLILPNFFWHEKDAITLTSKLNVWTYPNKPLINNSIAVLPELYPEWDLTNSIAICSDFIDKYNTIYNDPS